MPDLNSILQWVPALTGFGGVIVGSLITWGVQARLLGRRIKADEALAERKFDFDKKLAERKFEFDGDLAERKFKYDREFHNHKRRIELAETILAESLQVIDVIQDIRSPGARGEEAVGRTRNKEETDVEGRQLDPYYMPLARLGKHSELITGFLSKRYRSRAVLGNNIDQAFEEIMNVIKRLRTSSHALMHAVGQPEGIQRRNEANIKRYEADIWGAEPETDRLQPMMDRAIEIVEKVCGPILERDRTQ